MFRIADARKAKGLNMAEAARMLGLAYMTYVNYEKGNREPTSEVWILLADFYETSVDYLIGRVCHKPVALPQDCNVTSSGLKLSAAEKQLILKYRELDDRGQSAVTNTLSHEHGARTEKNTVPSPKEA